MTAPRSIVALLVGITLVSAELYAGGFQLNEHGARAMAQGGAFAARASDGSAIFFNPAGLAFQNEGSVYFGATAIIPTVSFYGPLQDNTNAKTKAPNQFFMPINIYGTYPLSDRWHVGIGVNNPYGLGSEWPNDWVGKGITTKVSLQSFFVTPTIAYRVSDDFSVGAGFNYVTGKVGLNRAVTQVPIDDPRATVNLSGTGVGFNLGALYKISPELSAGASYRSSSKINATGTAGFYPDYSILPSGAASTSITLPATGFLGLAYTVTEDLTVEGDVQYIGWSSYKSLDITFEDGSQSSTPKNYKDTYILRIGGEYTMAPLHIRAGYLFDHSPVDAAYVDPILPDANRNGLNLGLGYDLNDRWSVDAAYLLLLFSERQAINTIPQVNFDGTYHTRVSLIALNIGVKI